MSLECFCRDDLHCTVSTAAFYHPFTMEICNVLGLSLEIRLASLKGLLVDPDHLI